MRKTVLTLLMGLLLFGCTTAFAAGEKDTIPLIKVDDEITLFDPLDSLTNTIFNACYKFNKPKPNKYGFDTSYVPVYPDEVIMRNMSRIPTVIPLVYNQWVKAFINLYSVRKREQVRRMLGLSEMYFPIFEESLARRKMPMELKYLPIVESALNPNAESRVGATGLWQIMYGTGKFLNMDIHSYIDERRDPYRSTDAALTYLNKLYDVYGDWLLVIAAYNCGPGNVNKAIKRSGGKTNFWELKPYLPKETQGYVPAFIAAMYVMYYYEDFNFRPEPCGFSFNATDTVLVREAMSLRQISGTINMDYNELAYLNPSLIKQTIPATQNGYSLKLPINKVGMFVEKKDSIIHSAPTAAEIVMANSALSEKVNEDFDEVTTFVHKIHTVRSGESVGLIASKYHVSTSEVKSWNHLKSSAIYPGQKLKILVATKKVVHKPHEAVAAVEKPVEEPSQTDDDNSNADDDSSGALQATTVKYVPHTNSITLFTYVVKQGDNITSICRTYKCTPLDLKNWNNLTDNNLAVGQKLNIYIPTESDPDYKATVTNVSTPTPAVNDNDGAPAKKPKVAYYTVKSGDTLWDISKRYPGVTVDQIKRSNDLDSGKGLKVGMTLKIEF